MSRSRADIRRHRIGNALIIFGILMVFGALGLTVYNYWDGARADRASQYILEELIPKINENAEESNHKFEQEIPTEEIDGYLYIGIIDIPDAGICLPVMDDWDYKRLRISPCRYTGSYYTDDLVICGHNYPRHFSNIKRLDVGADVCFTNVNGEAFQYTVSNIETMQPTAVEQMVLNSNNNAEIQNEWDLTLFTCDLSGQIRYAVRCVKTESQTG